jgi:16S rRNA (uracil1498-N3)-methyltransferase
MRYFFIQDPKSEGTASMIKGSDARHIKNVLRLKSGDRIGLFDGKGMDYEARITAISSRSVEVMIARSFPSNAESPIDIIVAQAYLKERKMDGLVRQLSELGVSKWIPFFAQRSVPRPDQGRLASRRQRWQKIAREALKQSKRGRFMEIGPVVSFKEIPFFYRCPNTNLNKLSWCWDLRAVSAPRKLIVSKPMVLLQLPWVLESCGLKPQPLQLQRLYSIFLET